MESSDAKISKENEAPLEADGQPDMSISGSFDDGAWLEQSLLVDVNHGVPSK